MTEERKDALNETVKEYKAPTQEGYQPTEIKRGYQPTIEPHTHVPPQGVSALVPAESASSSDISTTTSVAATTSQATNVPTPVAPSLGNDTTSP